MRVKDKCLSTGCDLKKVSNIPIILLHRPAWKLYQDLSVFGFSHLAFTSFLLNKNVLICIVSTFDFLAQPYSLTRGIHYLSLPLLSSPSSPEYWRNVKNFPRLTETQDLNLWRKNEIGIRNKLPSWFSVYPPREEKKQELEKESIGGKKKAKGSFQTHCDIRVFRE